MVVEREGFMSEETPCAGQLETTVKEEVEEEGDEVCQGLRVSKNATPYGFSRRFSPTFPCNFHYGSFPPACL